MANLSFDVDNLENMKRSQLQKLCKQFGIKANKKTTQLVEDLKAYANNQGISNEEAVETSISPRTPQCCTPDTVKVASQSCEKQSFMKNENSSKKRKRTYSVEKRTSSENVKGENGKNEKENEESDDEYKKKLLEHLDKTAELKMADKNECRIPKLSIVGVRMPIHQTPASAHKNWERIHKSQFDKMESLDVYLEKKRKRTENLYQSVKKAKLVVDDARSAVKSLQQHKTPCSNKRRSTKIRKPRIQTANIFKSSNNRKSHSEGFNFTLGSPKNPQKPEPSVKRFSSVVSSTQKTVPTLSLFTSTATKVTGENKSRKSYSNRKSAASGLTPFRSSASVNTPQPPTPIKKFDLQASLNKPLSYKPYTGKLKTPPCIKTAEEKNKPKNNPYKEAAQKIQERMKTTRTNIKNVHVASRNDRRKEVVKRRAAKRDNTMMARRGISA